MKETFENLRAWRLLEAIDRKQSVTQASIELDLSLSNASKLLGKLEKELGASLVDRTSRPVQLTAYAQKLLPLVKDLLFVSSRLESVANTLSEVKSAEPIIFSLSTTSISSHVLEFINEFKQSHPLIEVELRTGLNHLAIREGKAHVVLISYDPKDENLEILPCGRCFNFMVASPAYLEKFGNPVCIEELLSHRLIFRRKDFYPECHMLFNRNLRFDIDTLELFEETTDGKKTIKQFEANKAKNFKKIYSSDYSSYVSALNGEGIGVDLPVSFLEDRLKDKTLVPILPGWHRSPWIKSLVYSSNVKTNSPVHIFAHWYREKELRDSVKRWTRCFARYGIPIED